MPYKLKKKLPYIVDNSVLIKPFLGEPGEDKVIQLLKLQKDKEISLFAPNLLEYEFGSVLSRKLSFTAAKEAIAELLNLGLGVLDISYSSLTKVLELANNANCLTYYDAAYYALALDLEAVLITADEQLYEVINTKHPGLAVRFADLRI